MLNVYGMEMIPGAISSLGIKYCAYKENKERKTGRKPAATMDKIPATAIVANEHIQIHTNEHISCTRRIRKRSKRKRGKEEEEKRSGRHYHHRHLISDDDDDDENINAI